MRDVKIPLDARSWDQYQAFHTFCGFGAQDFKTRSHWGGPPSPLVLFDTGEVICIQSSPNPNQRGVYSSIGVRLTHTKETSLWTPDGSPITRAWLDDGGMQYLLVDLDTKHAVRLDGKRRSSPRVDHTGSPLTQGIPVRFQYNCHAYIPGPGLPPIAHEKVRVSIPLERAGYTKGETEHIHMIVATGQAAMKLTDHAAVHCNDGKTGVNPDTLLKCQTWQDVPEALLPALAKHGAGRVVREYDYLLTEQP